jgi:hypothetical protein
MKMNQIERDLLQVVEFLASQKTFPLHLLSAVERLRQAAKVFDETRQPEKTMPR